MVRIRRPLIKNYGGQGMMRWLQNAARNTLWMGSKVQQQMKVKVSSRKTKAEARWLQTSLIPTQGQTDLCELKPVWSTQ